jgi:hypothetical protein
MVEQPLPPNVAALLMRAHDLEQIETGQDRIAAYRLTRALLGGARAAGFSAPVLAQCLGVRVSTLQGRAYSDGWVKATDIGNDAIRRWRRSGRLPRQIKDETGSTCYRASDLLTAMLNPSRRRGPR